MFDNAYSRPRSQHNTSLYISRCLFFFTTVNAPSSAALVSPRCSGCGIPSSLMREQRKAYKDGTKFARLCESNGIVFPGGWIVPYAHPHFHFALLSEGTFVAVRRDESD